VGRACSALCIAIAATGCFSPSPPLGLPCTQDNECPDGQSCDLITRTCGGSSATTALRDDSFADFTAEGAYLEEVNVEPGGFVGPIGYFTGGVKVSGIAGVAVTGPGVTFEDVMQNPITGVGVERDLGIFYGEDSPTGVGLTAIDDITVAVEGEIEFPIADDWPIELLCDDDGFLDIAAPGGGFERVLDCSFPTTASTTYTVTIPGWHRIRGAVSDTGSNMTFRFRVNHPMEPGGLEVPPIDRMRVRAEALPGVVIDAFDQPFAIDHRGSAIAATIDQTYPASPFQIGVGPSAFTIRSSGQILIDTEGDYTFAIDSVQGHRAWLDGVEIANDMAASAVRTETAALRLAAGWHDFVIDVHRAGGAGEPKLSFTIASGPDGAGPIATDHLRAIVGRDQRFATDRSTTLVPIVEGGTGTRNLGLPLPGGFVAEVIDVGFDLQHDALPTVSVTLDPPNGAITSLVEVGDLAADPEPLYLIRTMPAATGGQDWALTVTDTNGADGAVGGLLMAGITMTGRGGVAPFPTTFRYVSAPRELPAIVAFGTVRWSLRQATDPSSATVSVRSCDDSAACEAETFVPVAFDTVPSIAPRRFVQYAVDVTTDGDVPAALDAIEINYIAAR
jgi:hypothetical protein